MNDKHDAEYQPCRHGYDDTSDFIYCNDIPPLSVGDIFTAYDTEGNEMTFKVTECTWQHLWFTVEKE